MKFHFWAEDGQSFLAAEFESSDSRTGSEKKAQVSKSHFKIKF